MPGFVLDCFEMQPTAEENGYKTKAADRLDWDRMVGAGSDVCILVAGISNIPPRILHPCSRDFKYPSSDTDFKYPSSDTASL
jgi:hypothetical protein